MKEYYRSPTADGDDVAEAFLPRLDYCGRHSREGPWDFREHEHANYEFLYVTNGRCRSKINDEEFGLGVGDLSICRPGDVHWLTHVDHPFEFLLLGFHIAFVGDEPRYVFPQGDAKDRVVKDGPSKEFRKLLERILTEVLNEKLAFEILVTGYILELIVALRRAIEAARNGGSPATSDERVAEIVESTKAYIDEHVAFPIALDDLSENVYLSPYYLSRLFKKETGYSPIKFVIEKKMELARDLLTGTNLKVIDIAVRVGYQNPYYFFRLFKKIVGMTPSEYRRRAR
ncbi:MAG: AraC family transcriptional regulator [Planctomycetota bacterium]